jgi:hypothetical protein
MTHWLASFLLDYPNDAAQILEDLDLTTVAKVLSKQALYS